MKLHSVDTELASTAIDTRRMTRPDFKNFYKLIYGKKNNQRTLEKIEEAEIIRDRIVHGKRVTEQEKRKAVSDILEYAELFNTDVSGIAGFRPFGNLRGFKGRAKALNKSTSRWVLKGIGFDNM